MIVQPMFRPHHLALAIALTLGWMEVSSAQEPDTPMAESAVEEKPRKPRTRKPKTPIDSGEPIVLEETAHPLPAPVEPPAPLEPSEISLNESRAASSGSDPQTPSESKDKPLEDLAGSDNARELAKSLEENPSPPLTPQQPLQPHAPGLPAEPINPVAPVATANDAVTALADVSGTTARMALEQLTAGSNANLAAATLDSVSLISATMLSAMRRDAGNDSAPGVWLKVPGHRGTVARDSASRLKHATHGLLIGADWPLDEQWRMGVVGGKSETGLDARQYDGDLDSWHLGAYAARQSGPLALRLGASFASHDASSKRRVAFAGFSDRLSGNYHASTQQAFAELGWNLGYSDVTLEPFATLGYQRYHRDNYREKGGDAALRVFGQTRENLSTTLGLRAAYRARFDNGMSLSPRLSAGWKHLYGELDSDVHQQLVKGGKRFKITGEELDRNSLSVDAGLDFGLSAGHTLGLNVTAEVGDDSRSHGVTGQWRMAF